MAQALGVFTDGLASLARLSIAVLSFAILLVPWVIFRLTKQKALLRHVGLVWLLYHCIVNNALTWYVLSEKGQKLGREQFGDEHEAKLKVLLDTFTNNIPILYFVSITWLLIDFTSALPKTLITMAGMGV